jgi:hypothetical protein
LPKHGLTSFTHLTALPSKTCLHGTLVGFLSFLLCPEFAAAAGVPINWTLVALRASQPT